MLFSSVEMSNSGDMLSAIGKSLLKLQEIVDKQYMNEPFSEASSKMDTSAGSEPCVGCV